METIRIGVIGLGHLGNYHLQKYATIPDCRIVGVADILEDRARKAAEVYNCQAFADYRQMIGSVDAVSIAVPTAGHHEVAKAFLAADVDVLLEKPITRTMEEADDLVAVADARKRILQIGLVERFNPAIIALDTVLETPLFIEAHRLHPFFERGTDVDVILDLMIHDLDIILHYVKSSVNHLDAVGVPILSDKVDIANVRLSFESGCVANITASRVTGKTMQKIRFFGIEGYHAVDYGKRELVSLRKGRDAEGKVTITDNKIEVIQHDPLEQEIRSFVNAVIARTIPAVSGRDGREALALALEIVGKMKTAHEGMENILQ
ncbi:MAG: Gfo/Idh/MocA family oxidoreductase [Syntrophales bacterium]|nr:Gfo/Idh/MocA family oxidoreductase [Syntrophales bacterium]